MRRATCAAAAGALVFLAASPAEANGRFPASNQLLFSPTDTNLVVLRSTFGVMFSRDAGATWRWLCEDVFGLPPTSIEDPSLGLTAGGALIAGTSVGLQVSPDTGCSWNFAGSGLKDQQIRDVAVRADSPHALVVLASSYESDGGADGGPGLSTQVYASADDGATFSPMGAPIDPSIVVTTLDVAATDRLRLYVAGYRPAGATHMPLLLVSIDGGMHWIERATPPLVNEVAVYIAAVDPTNPDAVYLRTEGQSRLFVTSDAGQTFRIPLTLTGQMLGFALSSDGSKVYAGGMTDGVLMAARADLDAPGAFHQTSPIHVQCLATHGADLWACSDEASGFIAGVSSDDGAHFAAKLHLDGIQAPIACPADASAALCSGALFEMLCANLGGCATPDGGNSGDGGENGDAGDAGSGADAGPTLPVSSPKSSCGCTAAGAGGPLAFVAVLLGATFASIAARWRRGRKSRR